MILQGFMRKVVSRIVKDFKQKELIPLKILFFVQAATIAVMYPYLTIHMRELGITIEETAIMSAIVPVIGIIMPPLAGMVADKVGNFKLLLSIASLICALTALLLLVVPPARIRSTHPTDLFFDFGCDSEVEHLSLKLSDGIDCNPVTSNNATRELSAVLESCGLACHVTDTTSGPPPDLLETVGEGFDTVLSGRSYAVRIDSGNETRSIPYNVTNRIAEARTGTIRRMPGGFYFFPSDPDLYGLRCRSTESPEGGGHFCFIGEGDDVRWGESRGSGFVPGAAAPVNVFRDRVVTLHYSGGDGRPVTNLTGATCFDPRAERRETVTVTVYLTTEEDPTVTDTIELSNCEPRCIAKVERKAVCTNTEKEEILDPKLTFWSYLVVRVLIGIIGSTTYSMFEVAVISILREQKADYGLQRIYSTIGSIVASPVSGMLIDYASGGNLGTDFSPAFYLYAALKILFAILILFINLDFKQAAKSVIADFLKVLRGAEVICLLLSCFILGAAWGYIESFLFWFLEDLGGNRSLMGITVTVGGVAGIPLLILSGPIIDKIGHANVIFIGFVFYAVRLLGYSLIYNPYHCLYFEAMESITSSLAITAAVTYAAKLCTTTTDGSIQGLVGGLYYGVGKGAGTLIGGYLMKSYGTRATFRIFAVFTLSVGIAYFLINQLWIRKLPNREGNEICKKAPKEKPKVEDEFKVVREKGPKAESEESQKTQEEYKNEGYVRTEEEEKAPAPTAAAAEEGKTEGDGPQQPKTKDE